MGRHTSKLNALTVQKLARPGRFGDGGGLYLQIGPTGTKAWLFRYMIAGRAREMGLGPVGPLTLADARNRAMACRKQIAEGKDPIEERHAQKRHQALESAKSITFDQCAKAYIESHRPGWKNAKHVGQWETTLASFASPVFGGLPVQAVDTGLVMKALEPVWHRTPETASRLRNRIELVLSWATARGYRAGENPARWRGHLDKLLPKRSSVRQIVHHPALSVEDLPAFLVKVRGQIGVAPLALEFLILTAARTGEVLGATWGEFDLEAGVWSVPAARMKAKREHRVPLSPRAVEILKNLKGRFEGELVFPSTRRGTGLSNMALLTLLRRMGHKVTSHGFRSTFRDWAAERTNYPREVAEQALAHVLKDKVEAAYRRGDLFLKRRRLMGEWERFCLHHKAHGGKVLQHQPAAAGT